MGRVRHWPNCRLPLFRCTLMFQPILNRTSWVPMHSVHPARQMDIRKNFVRSTEVA